MLITCHFTKYEAVCGEILLFEENCVIVTKTGP